ncbi:MAG: hypothetical protein TR69_WS6001001380 [candidate division WS6 bacterium OLB20]|uniref:Uncharacterized protein n=1 Tax=candidate division WS6 bacterium OLB20 TaxID=1617426 RepID=A0A136LWS3_9BACT|nr:MAG: hypothetical protein TR69_WS6001001380 [candidate division WS6 bacterium OLB20]
MKQTAFLIFLYLMLPYAVFLLYLNSPAAIAGLIFLTGLAYSFRSSIRIPDFRRINTARRELLLVVVFSLLIFILLGGLPQFIGYEPFDWEKHNTVLSDLVRNSWPVVYESGKSLNYYLGFYLIPALAGKAAGSYEVAKLALSLWSMAGFVLMTGAVWLLQRRKLTGGQSMLGMAFLLLYSGIDWLVWLVSRGSLPPLRRHIEWSYTNLIDGVWTGFFQYGASITLLVYVPQHVYPALMGVFILSVYPRLTALLLPAVVLWSPFAAAGLVIIVAVRYLAKARQGADLRFLLLAGAGILPVGYMLLHHATVDRTILVSSELLLYIVFIAAELLLLLVVAGTALKHLSKTDRYVLIALCLLLAVVPLFRIGTGGANDILIRTVLPVYCYVLLMSLPYLKNASKPVLAAVVLLWLAGLVTPLYELLRIHPGRELREPAPSITEITGDETIHDQYLGRPWD